MPYLPAARSLQEDFAAHFTDPPSQRYIEPLARCAPAGVPKSFVWHGFEIRQYPGYVLFLFDSGTRIVHLDGSPHLFPSIKLWNADSNGHWEGNTLVVDVSNSNSKALFGRWGDFASENVHILERYVFDQDGRRFNYVATFTDPTVFSRPWTATIPIKRFTETDQPDDWHFDVTAANRPGQPLVYEHMERTCVENNGSLASRSGASATGPIISR